MVFADHLDINRVISHIGDVPGQGFVDSERHVAASKKKRQDDGYAQTAYDPAIAH